MEGTDKKQSLIQAHLFLVYGYHQIRLICSLALFNQLQTFHEKQNYLTDTLGQPWLRRITAEIFDLGIISNTMNSHHSFVNAMF